MLPANRTGDAVTNQMTATAAGEPGWYAHLLNAFGHAFTGAGVWVAVLLAATSLIIALGPLVSNRPQLFIGLGIALALGYWVTGQGLGELLTFGGTDPNNGPIIALIGLSVLPLLAARASEPTPAARLMSLHPTGAILGVLGLVLVPLAVAVTPAGSQALAPGPPQPTDRRSPRWHGEQPRLHARHVDVTLVLDAPEGRCQSTHEHVGHGRPERDRPALEVHRAAPAGGRSQRAHRVQ